MAWYSELARRILPRPDPCGGQAPRLAKSSIALHFLIPPAAIGLQFGTFRRWRAGIEVDWRAHPGSESWTCFRTNRSCRRSPAHQGVKSRSCGLVQRISTADSATPRPLRGTSPRATFSHSASGHRSTIRHVSPVAGRTLRGTSYLASKSSQDQLMADTPLRNIIP